MSDARQAELEATIVVLRHKLADAEAERDRLREAINADRPHQLAAMKALTAERDRLRAVIGDALLVLNADTDYEEWTALLGRLRDALDIGPTGEDP